MEPTEVVERPPPGLARGLWEIQPPVLYGAGALVLIAGGLYFAFRVGILKRPAKKVSTP